MSTGLQAQEDKDKDRYKPDTEKDKDDRDRANDNSSDREMNKRLSQDVYSRNAAAKDAVIVWDNTDDGYDGTYAVGDTKYMARYDMQGNYLETLVEKKWDDNVPANVRRSYDNSMYKSNKVDRFWEVNEPNRRGYYLEFKGNDGKSRRIWSDRDGKFSEEPYRKKGDY
jgi:hypothetical protein